MIRPQPHPRRIIDRRYKRLVMQNEVCVIAQQRLRLGFIFSPQTDEPWICDGSFEFHHVKPYGGGIAGSKVSDRRGVKVCKKHHDMAGSRATFERHFGIDLEAVIAELNVKYPPLAKPKTERKKSPGLRSITVQCAACGRVEHVPAGKLSRFGAGLRYRCLRTNELQVVRVA